MRLNELRDQAHAMAKQKGMTAVPIGWREAKSFVESVHRHHFSPQGWKWGLGAMKAGVLVGVVMVGRPVSRMLDDGKTLEVIRLATNGTKNACSFLYARAKAIARLMGYKRIITYILDTEPGTSLKAAGWVFIRKAGGGSWSRPSRKRNDSAPMCEKQLWGADL